MAFHLSICIQIPLPLAYSTESDNDVHHYHYSTEPTAHSILFNAPLHQSINALVENSTQCVNFKCDVILHVNSLISRAFKCFYDHLSKVDLFRFSDVPTHPK